MEETKAGNQQLFKALEQRINTVEAPKTAESSKNYANALKKLFTAPGTVTDTQKTLLALEERNKILEITSLMTPEPYNFLSKRLDVLEETIVSHLIPNISQEI